MNLNPTISPYTVAPPIVWRGGDSVSEGWDDMGWAEPLFQRDEVNAAAKALISFDESTDLDHLYFVVNNWRAIHSFPLNTLQNGLRQKAKRVDPNSVIAQRIKRLSSIGQKLLRFPEMKLTQMQDIGGCRAIVNSISDVYSVMELFDESRMKHKLIHPDNYIKEPKDSGYRGVHLIYRYFSDRSDTYNDLKIEIQLRSRLQHIWATAVETVGTFTKQALKSSLGEEDWLRFFCLMSTHIAKREQSPPVPGTPTDRKELKRELQEYAGRLDVVNRLHAYGSAVKVFEDNPMDADYYLLKLDPVEKTIRVTGYKLAELKKASEDYLAVERGAAGSDAVLVSVESMTTLRRAYPNYFLDTSLFVEEVKKAIQ